MGHPWGASVEPFLGAPRSRAVVNGMDGALNTARERGAPRNAPTNVPRNAPTNVPRNAPTNVPTNAPRNAPRNVPRKKPKVWQDGYWDRYMRDERHFFTTIAYIENNPVAAGLVKNAEDWPFGSARERASVVSGIPLRSIPETT